MVTPSNDNKRYFRNLSTPYLRAKQCKPRRSLRSYATKLRLVRKVQMLGAGVDGTGGVLEVR